MVIPSRYIYLKYLGAKVEYDCIFKKLRPFWLGNIHVLRNQDLGFSDPPFVITFSTERNQKLPFSDPPPSPLCDYVIYGCSLRQSYILTI